MRHFNILDRNRTQNRIAFFSIRPIQLFFAGRIGRCKNGVGRHNR
jgi:hypothetical protein